MSYAPIFIHSLFRSGSTYFFHVFRRSKGGNWCYQEPLHEWVFSVKDHPEELLTLNEETSRILRHPALEKPYFYELYETYHLWRDNLVKEIIYDDYFGNHVPDQTALYLQLIIGGARGRPVIQECRTSLRIATLKKRIDGVHIYLWRNPWDQWRSYQVLDYFDTTNQLIINAPSPPGIIHYLRKEIGFIAFSSNDIGEEIAYFNEHRLTLENSYLVFFTLWLLALAEGQSSADLLLNIDAASDSVYYREHVLTELSKYNITDIDLSDCKVPQSVFGEEDRTFFQKIEQQSIELFRQSGYSSAQLDQIDTLRRTHQPIFWRTDSEVDE